MLFKLGRKSDVTELDIKVGARFLRYIFDDRYDKGEVAEVAEHDIIVDFVDTVRSFPKQLVTLVYGHGDEHLMFYGEGVMVKDYRGAQMRTAQIDRLEDLLDFDKWMI